MLIRSEADTRSDAFVTTDTERMLRHEVAKRGILALGERWNCPLMWSHYAQQHEGVCLECSTPENVARNLLRGRYGADRSIPLSELYRSEEHTSELQSLMRISYAVFCLKKKIKRTQ